MAGRRSFGGRGLGPSRRKALYGLSGALFLTGVVWLSLHAPRGEDALPSPWETWCMKVHGACAMGLLFVLGSMLDGHILENWGARRNRRSGAWMTAVLASLAVTGYGLYYFGGEGLRRATEWAHWLAGLLAAPLIVWHVLDGRRLDSRPLPAEEDR